MALSTSSVWEVRSSVGSDTNGGAFIAGASGTDFSQQNSAQVTYTDLVIDATTNTKLTSAAFPFTSAHVGNTIQIASGTGFTPGFYQVLSVASNVATMDSAVGSTSSTGGHGKLGGALASVPAVVAVAVFNNIIWFKATAAYTFTSAISLSAVVDPSHGDTPIVFVGYTSTRGDNGRVSFTTSTNNVGLFEFGGACGYTFQNIDASSTAGTPGHGFNALTSNNTGGILLENCLIHGFHQGIQGNWQVAFSFSSIILFKCSVYSCTGVGVFNDGFTALLGCYIHDNASDGMGLGSNTGAPIGIVLVWRSVIKSNGGKGINDQFATTSNAARFPIVIESDVLNNTGDGISCVTVGSLVLLNSIADGNGGFGVDFATAKFVLQLAGSIAWRANSSGDVNNFVKSPTDVTLTGDPFTNRAGDDFTLNSTAGAGSACKGIGEPTTFPPA